MPTISQIVHGAQTTMKVASTVASIAPMAAPLFKKGTGKIARAMQDRDDKRAERRAAKLEEKTRAAIESADRELSAEKVEELWMRYGRKGKLDALDYIGGPGCFVIVTLVPERDSGEDIAAGSDIRGYYVGAGQIMGRAVHEQLAGAGDKDVYADYKYGQPMNVLFFPCLPDDFAKISAALRSAFDPAKAYG